MRFNDVKTLLTETSKQMTKHGVDVNADYKTMLADDSLFDIYKNSLAEGLNGDMQLEFLQMSDQVRSGLLSETVYGFLPQSQLVMPIFRKMWPQLVAREAFTILPIDQPEVVRYFMVAVAQTATGEVILPSNTQDVSSGTDYGVTVPFELTCPATTDVLAAHSLTSDEAHLQRDMNVVGATYIDNTGATRTVELEIEPDDDGNFSFDVDCGGGVEDFVSGNVDYFTGLISVSNVRSAEANGKVTKVTVIGSITGAEEMYANKIVFKHHKIHLNSIDHEIQAEWSIQYEQDIKAYFDINIQSEIVDTFGNAVAVDIDRRLLNRVLREGAKFHPTACKSFSKTPIDPFAHGKRAWANEVVLPLREISDQIYNDTNIGVANTLIGNPMDVGYIKSANEHKFEGNSLGGNLGQTPVAGTFDDSWKVLSTPIMPKGKVLVILKPDNPDNAVFIFAPYRPLTITPWPMGRKPSITFLSRYASRFIRREGVGVLTITD